MSDFDLLSEWIRNNGFDIIFEPGIDGVFDPVEKVVCVNSDRSDDCNKYYLLHECGHMIIRADTEFFRSKYSGRYSSDKHLYSLSVLSEEIDAWFEGKILSRELGIKLDENRWNHIMTESLIDYATSLVKG